MLESGNGGFGTIDLDTGKYHEIIQLPGFTRGLSFLGPLAFDRSLTSARVCRLQRYNPCKATARTHLWNR
ncbi:MAG TPA: hypothetical protein DHW22_08840 [Planctomycetaceae bacterium]|nr:hypothetical protein [Planctomycetaceae bacterium]